MQSGGEGVGNSDGGESEYDKRHNMNVWEYHKETHYFFQLIYAKIKMISKLNCYEISKAFS